MKEKKSVFKITHNGLKALWILIYLIYMVFFGFSTHQSINESLIDRTTYLVNLFDTLYNQIAIQMVSNPENFDRVLVSDIEGEILLQYGELIPAITNLEYNKLFGKVQTDKIVLSDFFYDPLIDDVCFEMGIIEKNRVYIGTLSAERFLQNNMENLKLDHFMIFDDKLNGYLYKKSTFYPISWFERDQVNWITKTLFISDNTLYLSHLKTLNNFQIVACVPFVKKVLPLFLFSIIPFLFGLFIIFLSESTYNREKKIKRDLMEKMLTHIIQEGRVPKPLLKNNKDFRGDLFRRLNDKFIHYDNYKKEMKRYVEKLSTNSEQILEMKKDVDYLEKYFYNLINQEEINFSESLQTLFRIAFEKNDVYCMLILKLNDTTIFSQEPEELAKTQVENLKYNTLELGEYKINYYFDFIQNISPEITDIRKSAFELFSRYMALVYSIKKGLNPEEMSLTKNFSTFSEMVEREIDKVKRYRESGILFYLELINYQLIKEKYGISVSKTILKRISEIILSQTRNSDIVGIYKVGTFLVYFCNIEEKNARRKVVQIGNTIYNDEKFRQIGINIELRSLITSVQEDTKSFDALLLKCLQGEKE